MEWKKLKRLTLYGFRTARASLLRAGLGAWSLRASRPAYASVGCHRSIVRRRRARPTTVYPRLWSAAREPPADSATTPYHIAMICARSLATPPANRAAVPVVAVGGRPRRCACGARDKAVREV
eukprot:scaffold12086_cov67-Phaeocystis_antarctica.AAC.8